MVTNETMTVFIISLQLSFALQTSLGLITKLLFHPCYNYDQSLNEAITKQGQLIFAWEQTRLLLQFTI